MFDLVLSLTTDTTSVSSKIEMEQPPVDKSVRGSRAVEVIKGSLNPRNNITAPPMLSAMASSSEKIDITGNFMVDDSLLHPMGEKILTSTGFILDFVARSVCSVARYGIVSARTISAFPSPAIPSISETTAGCLTDLANVPLIWTRATPLPYFDDGVNQLQWGPDLSQQFSLTRKYSGVLTVTSDTVSIGQTALNGILSGASLADTRDVAQSDGLANVTFDPATIVQCSVNAKDGIRDIPVGDGITSILGPDINVGYSQPSMVNVVRAPKGGVVRLKCNYTDRGTVTVPAEVARMTLYVGWVSPWGVEPQWDAATMADFWRDDGTGRLGPTVNRLVDKLVIPAINIYGTVRYRVEIENYALRQSPPPGGERVVGGPTLHVTATDFFACALPDGRIKYNTRSCTKTQYIPAYNTTVTFINRPSLAFDMDQSEWGSDDITKYGMYIGTFFRVHIVFDYISAGTTIVPLKISDMYITALPTSLYQEGELGPVRVLRWDGLTNGQVVTVSGRRNVQCVAQGSIAPFVQDAAMFSDTGSNLNVYPLLYEMYNGPTMFRRVWNHQDYLSMLELLNNLTSPEEMAMQHAKLVSTAQAAGVFDGTAGASGVFGPSGPHSRHATHKRLR